MRILRLAPAAVLALALTACGSAGHDMGSMDVSGSASPHDMGSMPGMHGTEKPSTGLEATSEGYTLHLVGSVANAGTAVRFRITAADGMPLTSYQDDQTQKLHFYLINDQLRRFQHVHPVLAADGTWTAPTARITGGTYRMYAAFIPGAGDGKGHDLVLSTPFTVPGPTTADAEVPPGTTATVAGHTVSLNGSATTGTGMLAVTVTRGGAPATDLETYLDTFAHMTAIREGDMAFAHMHPVSNTNGVLMFHTEFPEPGVWRLFLQFKTGGVLHTAKLTVTVN